MTARHFSRRRRFLMLISLYAQREQFMDNDKKRLILLTNWYLKRLERRMTNFNQMIHERRRRRWWIRPINQRRKEQGDGERLINKMRFFDIESHFKYCRMTVEVFDELLRLVGPAIQKRLTNFRKPICPRTRLYLTLRYLATGDTMGSIAFAFRIGHSTVSAIITDTCKCLWNMLQTEMFVPSQDNWKKLAKEFCTRWNFPHCIGAIDGKHVVVKAPPKSGSTFYNYKGSHSINFMAVASASYRFLLVDIGAEGRHSDGGVFKNSIMEQLFANNQIHVPPPSPIVENRNPMPYVLIADEAFPLTNYIMRPYPGKTLTNDQRIYNYRLSRARRVVENAFGIMVARWRIFSGPINTSLETTEKIIKACVVLHNFLMDKPQYCTTGFADSIQSDGSINLGEWREIQNCGVQSMGRVGSNTYARNVAIVRENFKNYFLGIGSVPWQWDLI